MKYFPKYTPQTSERGYTLLFAVIVSALVLSIGMSILSINKKEFLLTAGTRDSISSFYTADGGLECAEHADDMKAFDGIGTNVDGKTYIQVLKDSCPNLNLTGATPPTPMYVSYPATYVDPLTFTPPSASTDIFNFEAKIASASAGACVIVTVTKTNDARTPKGLRTIIDAKGYNTGWNSTSNRCNLTSAKRLERAIRLSY